LHLPRFPAIALPLEVLDFEHKTRFLHFLALGKKVPILTTDQKVPGSTPGGCAIRKQPLLSPHSTALCSKRLIDNVESKCNILRRGH